MRKLLLTVFLTSLPVFALDEKPLLAQGDMEAGLYTRVDGTYQMLSPKWGYYSAPTPTAPISLGMDATFKYGMSESSDLEISMPWVFRDADWAKEGQPSRDDWYTGFDRIALVAKVDVSKTGVGPLFGFDFPLGNEKVVGFDPEWGFTFGGWGGYHKANRWIDGYATWSVTPQTSSGYRPGSQQVAMFNTGVQLDEGVAPTFGMQWNRFGSNSLKGVVETDEQQSFTASPGCILELDEDWNLEVKVPVVFAGRNTYGTAGLSLGIVGSFEN